jgi:hypothetical protein
MHHRLLGQGEGVLELEWFEQCSRSALSQVPPVRHSTNLPSTLKPALLYENNVPGRCNCGKVA